ncbi:MAG: DUF4012 domain-containing protein [Patescibacteria group bacterium]
MNSWEDNQNKRVNIDGPGTEFLSSPLDSVIEQDGIVLSTPLGVRKKARRVRTKTSKKSIFNFKQPIQEAIDQSEMVERMDLDAVACAVRRFDSPEAQEVKVSLNADVPHSRFVISLRECFFVDEKKEARVSAKDHEEMLMNCGGDQASYKSLAAASLRSDLSPWMLNKKNKYDWAGPMKLFYKKTAKTLNALFAGLKKEEKKVIEVIDHEVSTVIENQQVKPFSPRNAILGFAVLAFLVTLPAQALVIYKNVAQSKGQVSRQGGEAVEAIVKAGAAADLASSKEQLELASGKFRAAENLLDSSRLMALGAAAVMPKEYKSAKSLLEAGEKMSEAGKVLSIGFDKVFNDSSRGLIERFEVLGTYSRSVLPLLADAETAIGNVSPEAIPPQYKDQFENLPEQVRQARDTVNELALVSDAMTIFLGKEGLRNYLIVFQNNTELRPSGGFIGSMAEIRMDRGKMVSLYVPPGGSYDIKGQLTKRVQAPLPLHLINPLWQFQDANWYGDFPKTAEQMRWFWSNSGQPTLDGIIAVNASFMTEVLNVTGPIDMPEYGKVITADNFFMETQKAVELEYDKEANTPKKFIGDLFDKILTKVEDLEREDWLKLAAAASKGLDTKEIQMAMFDEDEEQLIERFGWTGLIKESDGDSLAIVSANIAGQKTSAAVEEFVRHDVHIDENGFITDSIQMTRRHTGQKGELFKGVRNVEYVRFYVPKGSRLISASGFEPPPQKLFKVPLDTDGKDPELSAIEKTAKQEEGTIWSAIEDNRTVFGGWMQLDPGQSQVIELKYELPFTIYEILSKSNQEMASTPMNELMRGAYMMLFTSQSGKPRQLTQNISYAANWEPVWSSNLNSNKDLEKENVLHLDEVWDRDYANAVLLTTQQGND